MQLDQYISDLLYRYECVIVPGFGAFLTQYQPAIIHETTQAFYPPKKKLSFNAQLTDTDGLLANYIAKKEMIPHEDANAKIVSYVRFLFDSLHKGKAVEFKNIGSFQLSEENTLQFEPSYHLNYLTTSFGLSSFTSPQIAREVYKEEVEALKEKEPIAFTPERRTSTGWMKYAAIAVIGFGVAGFGGFNYLKNIEAHNYAAEQEAKSQIDEKIQQATFIIENPLPAITLDLIQPKGNYHVVAGAFRIKENAEKRIQQLQSKGYDKARLVGMNKFGLHQVVYGSYQTGQEALVVLRTVRKEDNKSAWLDVREL
ncbi:SPOR domain-containing protein [uncultured Dokdonia sp.]|mgnify:CR=1 FL=1|uniref:HU domain-containing protein n=1 Tax=uncultured Dokdonia sp. TaxID=575653 RepID=UPI00263899E8|nr:SPOR domain-containing protein [uncultured Dokdonia sp.]